MGCGLCRIQIYDASYETNHMIESQLTKSSIEEEKKLKILLLGNFLNINTPMPEANSA